MCLALPALADNTADEADIAFAVGNKSYTRRDYEGALAAYFLSYRLVPNHNVLFNIARCYEALKKYDEAYRYWHDLYVDPNVTEDDKPQVRLALSRLAPRVALVTVTTTPPGANVYVDRKDLGSRGQTPQTIALTPGNHVLLLELPGYAAKPTRVSAMRGREVKAAVALEEFRGTIVFEGTPKDAVVRETADGPELARVPGSLPVPPGKKLLVVQAPGYLPQQVFVDVKENETKTVRVALTEKPKPTGKVVVTANYESSLVRVNGKDSGFTPTVLTLAVGEYEVEISAPDVTPVTRLVIVLEDSETRLNAHLRYEPPKVGAAATTSLSVDQAPASVTVISRDELVAFGYQTVAEALRAVQGFFLSDDKSYTYVGTRGFLPPGDLNTRLLVLWDGHPLNDVWTGHGQVSRDLDVDLGQIERVEVVRGPASILYGTGAFFGVVNVVPRQRVEAGRHVEGSAGAGGLNSVKARATGSLGESGKSLLLSAGGVFASGANVTDLYHRGRVVGLDGEFAFGASMHGSYKGLTLIGKFNQRTKQIPTAPLGSTPGVGGTQATDSRAFAELRYSAILGPVDLAARVHYDASRYRGAFAFETEGTKTIRTDLGNADWAGGEVRAAFALFEGNRLSLSLGGSAQLSSQQPITFTRPEVHTRVHVAGTLLDEWQVGERFFVQAGLRIDKYSDLKPVALSPRAAVVAKLYPEGVTKIVVGQAFRAPTFYELYYNDDGLSQVAPIVAPEPELITTFELTHSHNLTPEFRISAGGFLNLINKLVVLLDETNRPARCGPVEQSVPCLIYGNSLGRYVAAGAEASLRWQPGRFTLVEGNYSFVSLTRPRSSLPGSLDLAYPSHLISLKGLFPMREGYLRLAAQVTYQSARRDELNALIGEALLVNAGFSGEFGALHYFAGVQNILDVRYSVPVSGSVGIPSISQDGRTLYLELSAAF
jgi:outer membrane receptor protein involved in Fe transport